RNETGPGSLSPRTSDPPETIAEPSGRIGWLESVARCEDGIWRSFRKRRPPPEVRVGDRCFTYRGRSRSCFAQEAHARLIHGTRPTHDQTAGAACQWRGALKERIPAAGLNKGAREGEVLYHGGASASEISRVKRLQILVRNLCSSHRTLLKV